MRCQNCPIQPGTVCPSRDHPRYCDLAGIPRYDAVILRRAGLDPGPSHFDRPRPDGRLRVGIVSPCCYLGGAERHITDLLQYCDPARIQFVGVALKSNPNVPEILTVRRDWEAHCRVDTGEAAIRDVALSCDLLATWGMSSAYLERLIPPGLAVVEISHCAFETPESQGQCAMPRSCVVAVALPSLRGVPPGRRATARIILNAVSADRVEPLRPRAEMLQAWGMPPDARVVLWQSRLGREKDPRLFLEGLARLPGVYHAAMIGAGMYAVETEAYARRICPSHAHFPGPTYDVGSPLGAADVMVMTSPSEGCCYSVMEAWKAGVPVISKRVGLLEARPDLARILPADATGQDVADAILLDHRDRQGTAARVARARAYADLELSPGTFGRSWTDLFCSLASPPEAPARPRAFDPGRHQSIMQLILGCDYRGDFAPSSCGCQKSRICHAGKGRPIPGYAVRDVTMADCRACVGG